MHIGKLSPELERLQNEVIHTCEAYEKALEERSLAIGFSFAGDAVVRSCRTRIAVLRDCVERLASLEYEGTEEHVRHEPAEVITVTFQEYDEQAVAEEETDGSGPSEKATT
jgi:hypothetical protein